MAPEHGIEHTPSLSAGLLNFKIEKNMPGKPGRGGKPGRSGRKSRAAELGLQQLLDECWTEDQRRECVKSLARLASRGEIKAITLLMAYCYGKPKERHEISGPEGEPIKYLVGVNPEDL